MKRENIMETNNIQDSQISYVGFWIRFFAYIIDQIILIFPVLIIYGIFNHNRTSFNIAINSLVILYWFGFEVFASGTPGKLILGLKIKDLEGNKLPYLKGMIRVILKFISILLIGLGVIIIAFTKKKQGLHDLIMGSAVVRTSDVV